MSEPAPPSQQAHPATPPPKPLLKIFPRMGVMQVLLFVVLLVFLWQWFDMHRQLNNMQQELARRLAELDGSN
ncbi:MAG: hypothetical protein Q7S51_10565, partial [Gallionellaceae bacterium]|nr:hypothetical protein [Gallionellaceae bacterium]